jgi:signal peptidase
MEPEYSVGDIIIVKLTDAEDIESGDVITFNPSNDSDAYLTHRVTEKLTDYNGTGVTCFRTKGDANNVEDSFLIDSSRVVGTVSFNIPKIGYAVRFVQLKWYIVLPLTVMILVLFQLLKIYFRDNGESGTETET